MQLEMQDTAKITRITQSEWNVRSPVQVSLGCHASRIALPHPDPDDSQTMVDGVKKRFACKMPQMTSQHRASFKIFVARWLVKNLIPLSSDTDTSVQGWLNDTHYPAYRREELLSKFENNFDRRNRRYLVVKSFMKDETYTEYKQARGINSRTDEYKTWVGPIFKKIEKELFSKNYFIKKIPVTERPQYILDRLFHEKYRYLTTDFTAFEAHFVELMEDCEMQLYDYMTTELPDGAEFRRLLRDSILKDNFCQFKWLDVSVYRRRMSGEMCTSLGNGFTNLMLIKYIFSHQNIDIDCLVEGDDGLISLPPGINPPSVSLLGELGLKLKMELVPTLETASFCGNVFDLKDMLIVTDPIVELASFGWTTGRYAKSSQKRLLELLRSKSLSLMYQYKGNPILASLAKYGLRMTEGIRARPHLMNEYEREEFQRMMDDMRMKGLPDIPVPLNTRLLVEKLYKVPIHVQLDIERYLDSLHTLTPLEIPHIDRFINRVWSHYYEHYAVNVPMHYELSRLFPEFINTGATPSAHDGLVM